MEPVRLLPALLLAILATVNVAFGVMAARARGVYWAVAAPLLLAVDVHVGPGAVLWLLGSRREAVHHALGAAPFLCGMFALSLLAFYHAVSVGTAQAPASKGPARVAAVCAALLGLLTLLAEEFAL